MRATLGNFDDSWYVIAGDWLRAVHSVRSDVSEDKLEQWDAITKRHVYSLWLMGADLNRINATFPCATCSCSDFHRKPHETNCSTIKIMKLSQRKKI